MMVGMSHLRTAALSVATWLVLSLSTSKGATRAAPSVPDVVQARAFEVVDSNGQVRGALGVTSDGPALLITDAAGHGRAGLGLGPTGEPVLVLRDAAGKNRAALSLAADGMPGLFFYSAAKVRGVTVGIDKGGPVLDLADPKGVTRARLEVDAKGAPRLVFADAAGTIQSHVP
jgi:hypothetical protein